MNELCVKDVTFNGAQIRACQDENGMIFAGLRWVCEGIGLSADRIKYERKKVQEDIVLCKGVKFYPLGNDKAKSLVLCLQIDYLPLWLAKITITPKMEKENPMLVERVTEYQLRVKDVLAREFLSKSYNTDLELINQKLDRLYNDLGKLTCLIMDYHGTKLPERIVEEPKIVIAEKSEEEKWKEKIYASVNEYQKKNYKYASPQAVLKSIYIYMRRNYGIVWEQEAKEYRNKYGTIGKTLDYVYEKDDYKSIFESILMDMVSNGEPDQEMSLHTIILPLIKKYKDTSANGCVTYRKVYEYMHVKYGINWKIQSTRFMNKNSCEEKPKKRVLIAGNPRLKRIFKQSVSEMMMM